MKAKIAKWGNSLALRLPKSLTSELGLSEDATVELEIVHGKLVVMPHAKVYKLAELVAAITPENCHPEVDWGPAVGAEFF